MIGLKSLHRAALPGIVALALLSSPSQAQQSYPTPEDAAAALAAAVKSGPNGAILKVLGNKAEDIISSGDEVADADTRQRFTSMYDSKHSIKAERNKKATLMLGPDDFPFAIPLVNTKTGWEFDTDEGRIEVLYRRIGRNELDSIQTCLAFVDAENEYADKDRGEGVGVYAQRIVSAPGKKDGLFWRDDSDPSPFGALAAEASAEGYKPGNGQSPYHGYFFRILKQQGPDAPGGAFNYVEGQDDRRFRTDCLARRVRQFGCHDLPGQSRRHRLSEGSGEADREHRIAHQSVRSGPDLEESGRRETLRAGRLCREFFIRLAGARCAGHLSSLFGLLRVTC